ncbi:MAG: hypothetical protein GWO81_02825 [Verrucomicrobia bacterium]|nr:hypothetical protein [Verrucomicrobiota bacterium]
MFSFVGGALVELILPLDTTKYLYRAVVFIPGLILLPVQLAQKKLHVFLLPACFLLFGTISSCWSYPQGYQQLASTFEYSLYAISFLAIITYAYPHYKVLENHFLPLLSLATIAVISDIIYYVFFFQDGARMHGSLGTINSGIGAMIYALCALLAFQQIKKRKILFNFKGFMLLFAAFAAITALFLTNSRASIFSLALALFILCLIQRRAKIYVLAFGVFLAAICAGLTINSFKYPKHSFEAPLEKMVNRSMSNRILIWQRHLSLMDSKSFFYGRGLAVNDTSSENEKKRHPHNLFLSSFYYLGAIGLILHFIMFSQIAIQSYRDFIANNFLLPCLLGLSFLPSVVGGISIHPYLDGISPELLTFWFIYALSCINKISQTNHI